ncbi:GntR family transcriptional regulator [Stappia sp. ES.058]|uniref:GntR family transcriptional regulator n=1 Tax=Stappia sp. ES.058 TaxID=1881061 RepID=UPI001FCCF8B6|nr:GntR family transcriptional regulator [Stappia sp. ES.058]
MLDPLAPIAPQLFRALRDRIIHNDLPPSSRISETEIAREFGISRQPVREAFIKLAGEDLLAILPQRGTVVRKIRYEAVLDARFLREAIESDIVRILASTPNETWLTKLREQIEEQRAAMDGRPEDFFALDDRFHRTLAAAAGKKGAWRLIEGLKSQMDRVRFLSLVHFPVPNLVRQHEAIVEHIAKADVAGAEKCVREHLREVLNDLPKIAASVPGFFEMPDGDAPRPVNVNIQGGDDQ